MLEKTGIKVMERCNFKSVVQNSGAILHLTHRLDAVTCRVCEKLR